MARREAEPLGWDECDACLRHVPEAVVVVDTAGVVWYASPPVRTVVGHEPDAMVGDSLFDYVHDADVELVEPLLSAGGDRCGRTRESARIDVAYDAVRAEVRVRTADDEWVWLAFATTGEPVVAPDRVLLTARDVSDRRRLARRAERLDDFAASVAHDLQSPLSVASGSLALYRKVGDEAELDRVERAHRRMERLTAESLVLARQGSVIDEPGQVSVRDCARRALATTPLPVDRVTFGDGLPTVSADADRLRSLFENLFGNVVDHAGSDPHVWVEALPDGFAVEDDGPGLPDGGFETAFESGYSTGDSGTGLGLHIVETIATAHGWDVTATTGRRGGLRVEMRGIGDAGDTHP